eukprot:COSAG04_NODE_21019_length_381_cov_1.911348_1_plen_75_part_10
MSHVLLFCRQNRAGSGGVVFPVFGLRRTFFLPPAADFAFASLASFVFSAAMLCDGVELQPAQPAEDDALESGSGL